MSLSHAERAELVRLASTPPDARTGIQQLAWLYRQFGAHGTAEVTAAIAEATHNFPGSPMYFSGFIAGTDSQGFRAELVDPLLSNPQTGHFFSYVAWALDGVSDLEYAAAIGHELFPDPLDDAAHSTQLARGMQHAAAFRRIVVHQPMTPTGQLDYIALDIALNTEGWNATTLEPWAHAWLPTWHMDDGWQYRDLYTGNSLQDLRCTVAALVFGHIVQAGGFHNAGQAAAWLDANVLDHRHAAAGPSSTPTSPRPSPRPVPGPRLG
ncbi:MAG: hypothetical protein IPJ08_09070 [Burkholderiales bacterium]|nr:hypothetical protein [Burkholderiales bacterium]